MIKAIIFDLDGVLVDACEWHRVALNESLKEICNYEISIEDHYNEFNGIPTRVKLKKLFKKGIIKEDLFEQIEFIKQKKTIEAINNFAFVRNEKIELMNFLKQKNVKIGCYTNSIRETAELMLKKTGIYNFFDLVVTNQDVKKPKPDPEGYFYCLNYFKILPENIIIVEDSPNGLLAAIATKSNVVKVANQDQVNIDLLKDYL